MAVTEQKTILDKATEAHQRYILKSANEDLSEAINCYIESIRQNPYQSRPYYRLATLMYKNGQIGIESAIKQCQKAVRIDPDDSNAHMYLGYFLSLDRRFNESEKEFKQALKLNPKASRSRLAMALTLMEKIRTEKSSAKDYADVLYYGLTGTFLSVFDRTNISLLCKNIKNDIHFTKQKVIGEFYETIKSDKKAYDAYLDVADSSIKSISIYEKMAAIAIKKQKYDIAFDCLNNVVILSDKDPLKVVNAIEFVEKYEPDKTDVLIDYYTIIVNKYPEISKCYYELGHLYLKKNEQINALSAFKLALKYEENNPYYQNALAYAYIQIEQYDSAIELYKKALANNPNNEWSAIVAQALATIYHQIKGNSEAAITTLENSLCMTENKAPIYEGIADIYYDMENLEGALENYTNALKYDENNPKLYSRLAMTYWELDLIEQAIIYYSKSIQLNPKYDIAYNNLGVVFLDGLGDTNRAEEYFKGAIELNPTYVLAHFNLARNYEAQNAKIIAAKEYQLALNYNQDKKEIDDEIIKERLHKLFET